MKVRTVGVLSLFGLVMSAGPIWAGPVGIQRNFSPDQEMALVAQLEAQRHQVTQAIQGPVPQNKGPALIHNLEQYSKLDDLIARLQSERPVAPEEIDQALQPTLR
jgi:hypothetical protein